MNNVQLILTGEFASVISDQESVFTDNNANYNSKISQSEITDPKTSFNWFKPVYTQLSDITNSQKTYCHIKL